MQDVDWGSVPSDVLNTVSTRCSAESVAAIRAVSKHWNRTSATFERCRYSASQNPAVFQFPPHRAFNNLRIVELVGVEVSGAGIEEFLANRAITTLAVRKCLIDVRIQATARPMACAKFSVLSHLH